MLSLRGTIERIKHKHDSFYKCVCFVCDTQCVTHKWRQETFLRVCVVGKRGGRRELVGVFQLGVGVLLPWRVFESRKPKPPVNT